MLINNQLEIIQSNDVKSCYLATRNSESPYNAPRADTKSLGYFMKLYFLYPLQIHLRVVFALMMREIHTIHGKSRLGYLWVIVHFSTFILTIWIVRVICHLSMPHGLSILSFLIAGYTIFYSFQDGVVKCIKAVESNQSLLTFPQVTPIDIMIARCVVIYSTNIISAIILIFIGYIFKYDFYINNLGILLLTFFLSFTITLGLGMTLASLNSYFTFIERVLPIVLRILLLASGVIFSTTSFSGRIGDWFFLNPILQLIELCRTCISMGYSAEFVSLKYLFHFALYSITVGFLLEKFTRKRLMT